MNVPVAVVETTEFLRCVRKLMTEDQRVGLIDFLARHPDRGDIIQGTGGVRKLRWATEGRGKSGEARIIYFFHNSSIPVFVLSAYAKSHLADISDADRNDFKRITKLLVETYGKTRA